MIDIAAEWRLLGSDFGVYSHFLSIYDENKQLLFKSCLGNGIVYNNRSAYAHARVTDGTPANPLKEGELCSKGKAYDSGAYDVANLDKTKTFYYEYAILAGEIQDELTDTYHQKVTVVEEIRTNTYCKVVFKVRNDNTNQFEPGRRWIIFRDENSRFTNVAVFEYYSESRDDDGKLIFTRENKLDQGGIYTVLGYSAYCDNAPEWHTAELIATGKGAN